MTDKLTQRPEFYTEELLESRCHKAVAWHIRALQAYIETLEEQVGYLARLIPFHFSALNGPPAVDLAYLTGALAMSHYYHGDYATDEFKGDHAGRAMRPEHIEWAKANVHRLSPPAPTDHKEEQ